MPASSKPKPAPKVAKSAKSEAPVYKKFIVFYKASSDITADTLAEYISEVGYDYGEGVRAEYVITDEDTTQAEFDKAWEAA